MNIVYYMYLYLIVILNCLEKRMQFEGESKLL